MKIISLAFSLFLLMDPIGNIPLYINILKKINPKKQRQIIVRELLIALFIIILFTFLGEGLMQLLHIRSDTLQVAGGIILFLLCLRMIFPHHSPSVNLPQERMEPFIVPLAVPLVAGPGVLVAVMIYVKQNLEWVLVGAVLIAWVASLLILLAAPVLEKILGERGITALEKLMGLILILIAVQMFLTGITAFSRSL